MGKIKDISNYKFGRLVAIDIAFMGEKDGRAYWNCLCDCGKKVIVSGKHLRLGNIKSCGCLNRDNTILRNKASAKQNGLSRTKEYNTWHSMMNRCFDNKIKTYKHYGGRGITVCDRWKTFKNFYEDMGISPPKYTLERIDNNGNYEPSNCKWADRTTQSNNRRTSRKITLNGKTLTVSQWSEILNINRYTIYQRLDTGKDGETALTTPIKTNRNANTIKK